MMMAPMMTTTVMMMMMMTIAMPQVILLSRGAVAFSGRPSDAEAHFAATGRPFTPPQPPQPHLDGAASAAAAASAGAGDEVSGGGAAATGEVGDGVGVNPTDAILDAIGDAEARMDREVSGGLGGGGGSDCGGHLVVMSRELLVEQVRDGESVCGRYCGSFRHVRPACHVTDSEFERFFVCLFIDKPDVLCTVSRPEKDVSCHCLVLQSFTHCSCLDLTPHTRAFNNLSLTGARGGSGRPAGDLPLGLRCRDGPGIARYLHPAQRPISPLRPERRP